MPKRKSACYRHTCGGFSVPFQAPSDQFGGAFLIPLGTKAPSTQSRHERQLTVVQAARGLTRGPPRVEPRATGRPRRNRGRPRAPHLLRRCNMALATRTFTPKTKTHVVDRILERLEDDDRNWLLNQLADLSVTNVWISEQLDDEGFSCSESSVADWRRRRKAKA